MGQHYRSADFGGMDAAGVYDDDVDDDLDDNDDKFSYQGGGVIGRRQYEAFKSAAVRQQQLMQQPQQLHHRPPHKPQLPAKQLQQPVCNDYEPERARHMEASMRGFSRSSRDIYGDDSSSYKDPHYATGGGRFDQHFADEQQQVSSSQHPTHSMQPPPSPIGRSTAAATAAGAAMPRSESNKFSSGGGGYDADEQGFESDFNSPPNNDGGSATNKPAMHFTAEQSKPSAASAETPTSMPRPQSGGGGGGRARQPSASSATSATAGAAASQMSYTPKGSVSTPSALEPPSPLILHQQSNDNAIAQPPTGSPAGSAQQQQRTPTPKLRFDDCVTVAKFDRNAGAQLFDDDDFSKAEFSFEAEDQWNAELPATASKRVLKPTSGGVGGSVQQQQHRRQLQQQQADNLRKSESVNIFAKNNKEDPFKDDDFFEASASENKPTTTAQSQPAFKWENDFAKFDENI